MLFKCMECGQEFGQITGKHVKRHGYATVKEYLEKYPSGYFNQLAEARLDELLAKDGEKKVQIKGSIENPFSKGTVTGIGKYFIGDTYTFESAKRFEEPKRYTDVVTSLAGDQVIFNGGERAFDLLERAKARSRRNSEGLGG